MKSNFNLQMPAKSLISFSIIILFVLFIVSCGSSNSSSNPENAGKSADSVKTSASNADNNDVSESDESTTETTNQLSETTKKVTEKATDFTVKASLEKAKKDGNTVFLIVTDSLAADIDKAKEITGKANKSVKKSVIVQMDRNDKNNKELVSEYGLAGAPLPVILVFSPKGVLAGGYILAQATADNLVKLIPSPKQDDVLQALNNGKSVFIVAAKKTFTDKDKVIENCKSAVSQLGAIKSEIIQIDMDDSKEKSFLDMLKINTSSATTATVVLNSKGQINGTFYELKDAASLVTLANKVTSGGCSPGACGSSKSCGSKKACGK